MSPPDEEDKKPVPLAHFRVSHGDLYLRPQCVFGIYDAVDGCNVLTTFGQGYKVKGTARENYAKLLGAGDEEPSVQ